MILSTIPNIQHYLAILNEKMLVINQKRPVNLVRKTYPDSKLIPDDKYLIHKVNLGDLSVLKI